MADRWAVIGSGVAGLSIAEILGRNGHSVDVFEKNSTLASETSREFHEWLHQGSLYTLLKDNRTLRYIIGALDDIFNFYEGFPGMNFSKTENGLDVHERDNPWFINENIWFHFRKRPLNPVWSYITCRSILTLKNIQNNDWLRRIIGSSPVFSHNLDGIVDIYKSILTTEGDHLEVQTPDLTMRSRSILGSFIRSIMAGRDNAIYTNCTVVSVTPENDGKIRVVYLNDNSMKTEYYDKVAICAGRHLNTFLKSAGKSTSVSTSYAPIAVMGNTDSVPHSFTALDYYPKNCVNILRKENNVGLANNISLPSEDDAKRYLDGVVRKLEDQYDIHHLSSYIGQKTEITVHGENRNYLYHIVGMDNNIYGCIPGKFTLSFSLAPEFYRQVYHKNPTRRVVLGNLPDNLLSNTVWQDVVSSK
jgi:hypothetical protein